MIKCLFKRTNSFTAPSGIFCTPDSHRAHVRGETSTCLAALDSDRPRDFRSAFNSAPVILVELFNAINPIINFLSEAKFDCFFLNNSRWTAQSLGKSRKRQSFFFPRLTWLAAFETICHYLNVVRRKRSSRVPGFIVGLESIFRLYQRFRTGASKCGSFPFVYLEIIKILHNVLEIRNPSFGVFCHFVPIQKRLGPMPRLKANTMTIWHSLSIGGFR